MKTLREQLKQRMAAILDRWQEDVFAEYSEQARVAWARERDRFANPVGHALRVGMRAVLEAVLDEREAVAFQAGLDEALRIRAVQELSPAEAVGFVFHLKEILRAEAGDLALDPRREAELWALAVRVDRAALAAFEAYTGHRERYHAVRINELKKNIPWVVTRASQVKVERESA